MSFWKTLLKKNRQDIDELEVITDKLATPPLVTVSSNKTLLLSDAKTVQNCVNESGTDITITVPLNANVEFPIGTEIGIVRYGEGEVTIAGEVDGDTVQIKSDDDLLSIVAQNTTVALKKMDDDEWLLVGSLGV
jgi:hypothetical protein